MGNWGINTKVWSQQFFPTPRICVQELAGEFTFTDLVTIKSEIEFSFWSLGTCLYVLQTLPP